MNTYDLIKNYKTVSFIGMCKNAGKTTTLNKVIDDIHAANVTLALTSIGRDGENNDVVTNTEKPGIFVHEGDVVATTTGLLKYCDITKEIIYSTGIYTPIGEVVIMKARSHGYVQVAGPSITTQIASLYDTFNSYKVDKILVDGALGRKSLCSKKVSDCTILSTGASYDRSIDKVVDDTLFISQLLDLKATELNFDESFFDIEDRKYTPIDKDGNFINPNDDDKNAESVDVANDNSDVIINKANGFKNNDEEEKVFEFSSLDKVYNANELKSAEAIVIRGALTDSILKPLLLSTKDLEKKSLIVRDSSKILISPDLYEKAVTHGLRIEVLDPVKLLFITINPFSAYGFHFDKNEFMIRMQEKINKTIINVRDDI